MALRLSPEFFQSRLWTRSVWCSHRHATNGLTSRRRHIEGEGISRRPLSALSSAAQVYRRPRCPARSSKRRLRRCCVGSADGVKHPRSACSAEKLQAARSSPSVPVFGAYAAETGSRLWLVRERREQRITTHLRPAAPPSQKFRHKHPYMCLAHYTDAE